ncbi:MAG: hypothetical protein IKX36_00545 [Prevotella sp.]|nr:hypothetical protein [Prevotella sp.]
MKQAYITPQVEITHVQIEAHLCAASGERRVLEPLTRFGSDLDVSDHGNAAWVDEGYAEIDGIGIAGAIGIGEDDGTMDSRANSALWEE